MSGHPRWQRGYAPSPNVRQPVLPDASSSEIGGRETGCGHRSSAMVQPLLRLQTARQCGWFLTRPSFWNDFRTVPLLVRPIPRAGRLGFFRRSTPMNVGNERSRSLWMDVEVAADASPLGQDISVDTVVIGAGIAGLSTAYELSGQGQKVVVLDRGKIGIGMTARTTAHLSANNDDTFKTMIDRRGEKLARDFYQSQQSASDRASIQFSPRNRSNVIFAASTAFSFRALRRARKKSRKSMRPREGGNAGGVASGCRSGYEKTRSCATQSGDVPPDQVSAGLVRRINDRRGRLLAIRACVAVEEEEGNVIVETESGAGGSACMWSSPRTRRSMIGSHFIPSRHLTVPMR